jgi:hypothetical protein
MPKAFPRETAYRRHIMPVGPIGIEMDKPIIDPFSNRSGNIVDKFLAIIKTNFAFSRIKLKVYYIFHNFLIQVEIFFPSSVLATCKKINKFFTRNT